MLKKIFFLLFFIPIVNATTALITGVNGQDGYYLKKLLEEKKYNVIGLSRNKDLEKNIISCNYESVEEIKKILEKYKPDEIYNLAAISSVAEAEKDPASVIKANTILPINILQAIYLSSIKEKVKFFHASSAEIFGSAPLEEPQTEDTIYNTTNIYGISKLASHRAIMHYRTKGLYAVNGILYNHESEIRPDKFVSKKIVNSVKKIVDGDLEFLTIGNLDVYKDWSYAPDVVEGMHLSLQKDKPDDYIFASGEKHSIREFIESVFAEYDVEISWQGEGLNEIGYDSITNKALVKVDPQFFRSTEIRGLNSHRGDSRKAKEILGWEIKSSFRDLVKKLVQNS